MKTLRMCALFAVATLALGACSDDDNNIEPVTPPVPEEPAMPRVAKMEYVPTYVGEMFEGYFPITERDITEMKYDEKGRLTEWIDNGKSSARFTYEENGTVKADTDPEAEPSFELHFTEDGLLKELVKVDGTKDTITYNELGQCIQTSRADGVLLQYEWTNGQMTWFREPNSLFHGDVSYSYLPRLANASYLSALLLNTNGYRQDVEVGGWLTLSSDKYLPSRVVLTYEEDGEEYPEQRFYYDATYDFDQDGLVKSMHITITYEEPATYGEWLMKAYEADVNFTYHK